MLSTSTYRRPRMSHATCFYVALCTIALSFPMLVGCAEHDQVESVDTHTAQVEPGSAVAKWHGEFHGTVVLRSHPAGLLAGVAPTHNPREIEYLFVLQQHDVGDVPEIELPGATLIYNRDAFLIRNDEGRDIVFARLGTSPELFQTNRTIDHGAVSAQLEFEGYGIAYYPPPRTEGRDSHFQIASFLNDSAPLDDLGISGSRSPACSGSCLAGGPGATSCGLDGGCNVSCESGYYACCTTMNGCGCCEGGGDGNGPNPNPDPG